MAGWPSLGRVEDRRLAQALREDHATALAEIFDFYAPRLFDYSHALLRDQDLAADAVHDSLIATQQHIGKLREPERFRSWVYAIVRNECLRLLADSERPEQRHPAPEQSEDTFLDAEERQRREETRQLVHSALAGMGARHREAVDLSARHDLSTEELAGVLGISSQQATELVAQARDNLDSSLTAAITARAGRDDCPSVAALVDANAWPLPPEIARKLIRHIESCPVCRERRKRKVSTNRLMQVLPVATMPSDLRVAVLSLAEAPDQHENRTIVAQRAEPFDVWGWPTSLERRIRPERQESDRRRGTPFLWPVLGAAACVLLIVGAIFLITSGGGAKTANAKAPDDAAVGAGTGPSDFPSPSDSAVPTRTPRPPRTKHSPTPTPTPAPAQTPTRHSPTPGPITHRPASPTHGPTRKPAPPATLSVVGCDMGPDSQCTISLTASGGDVSWTASAPDSLSLGQSSGTVKNGQTLRILVSKVGDPCPAHTASVTFSSGGPAGVTWKCG